MNDAQKLGEFIKDMKFTMMTTTAKDGTLFSRPMATLEVDTENFQGDLWFFTQLESPKVKEIGQHQQINLAYSDPENQRYASVSGMASISQNRAMIEKLWNPLFQTWFPQGLQDPSLALIHVEVTKAELWDSPPGPVVQLVGFLKAKATGAPYQGDGQNSKISMDNPRH